MQPIMIISELYEENEIDSWFSYNPGDSYDTFFDPFGCRRTLKFIGLLAVAPSVKHSVLYIKLLHHIILF